MSEADTIFLSVPAPFEIIPTNLLSPTQNISKGKITSSNNNNNNNNNNNTSPLISIKKYDEEADDDITVIPKKQLKTRDLDYATGVAILKFVYSKKGSIEKSMKSTKSIPNKSDMNSSRQNNRKNKPTFYIGNDDGTSKNSKLQTVTSLAADRIGLITEENVKAINKKFLMDSNVTIYNLIADCQVSIIELHLAGILVKFDDLLDLGFLLSDLTIGKRDLFNADKLKTFFQVDYPSLRDHDVFSFTIVDIIEADLYASELETLEFKFSYLIKNKWLGRQDLRDLNFGLDGLKLLGFKKKYMVPLKISQNFAIKKLKWTLEEYNEFMV